MFLYFTPNKVLGGVKIKNYVVKQIGKNDCASACILSVLKFYNSNYNKEELSNLLNESVNGTTAYDIIETLKFLGFYAYGIKTSIDNITVLPSILHTKTESNYHYIVLLKIDKKYVEIIDPAYGKLKIKKEELEKTYTGVAIIFYPVKTLPKITIKNKRILNIKRYKSNIFVFILLSLVIISISLLLNSFLKYIIDYKLFINETCTFVSITFIFLFLSFLRTFLSHIKNKLVLNINYNISKELFTNIINHLLNISFMFFKNKTTGEVINKIYDISEIRNAIIKIITEVIFNILLIIFIIIVTIFINIYIFLMILGYILIISIISYIFYKKYLKYSKILLINENNIMSNLTQTINNIESIRNINKTNYFIEKIRKEINKNNEIDREYYYKINFNTSIKNIINDFSYVFIIFIVCILIYYNKNTIGDLVYIYFLFNLVQMSINNLFMYLPELTYSFSAFDRINELLKLKTIEKDNKIDILNGNIIVNDLMFSYNNKDYINKKINFEIKEGNKVLIVGKNSTGKSTFTKILKKYYENYKGEIFIGNKNLKNISYNILNTNIIIVSQKENLFSDTIENNIKLNNKNIEKYKKIINLTKVDEIINRNPLKNKFFVDENCFNLSGGEKQRIILARALMNDFNYLIIDEALSEVDKIKREIIIKNINIFYKNKTIIYISHNDENYDLYDQIIKF